MRRETRKRIAVMAVAMLLVICVATTALAAYTTIPFGEKSDAVRKMQTALKKHGFYKGSVDGSFGQATRSAVYRFQKSIGIKADGKPGNKTLTALYEGTSAINGVIAKKTRDFTPSNPHTLYYGCTGSRVSSLQRGLKAAGYYKGAIDGTYGDLTELAVRKFQTAKGMKTDGVAGPKTLASLNNAQKEVKISTSFLLTIGSRGSEVRTLQVKLQQLGYTHSASITPDALGVYGKATAEVVRNWQKGTGKAVTGTVTESQYNTLVTSGKVK